MSKATLDLLGWGLWGSLGGMMLMFGVAWLFAARLSSPARRAVKLVAAFNLVGGVGLVLVGLSSELPFVFSHTVPNLTGIVSWVLMWRAAAELLGLRDMRREQTVLVGVSCLLVILLGGSPAYGEERQAVSYLANAWVGLRAGWQVARKQYASGSTGMAVGALLSAWGMSLPLAARAIGGLILLDRVDLDASLAAQPLLAAFGLFCTVLCNLLVANVVFGRVVRELNRLSERDPLTGMLSGNTVERSLDYEWRQGADAARGVAVLVLTIDDMAGLRSAHGEAIGDLVIAEAALQFKLLMRPCDVLGHEGQGRFLMVLHATSASFATGMARSAVHVLALDDGLHPEAGQLVTLSVGLALQPEAADPQALLALARSRRDAACAAGGNRVEAGPGAGRRDGAAASLPPVGPHAPSAEGH